jgi:hypothetical protein
MQTRLCVLTKTRREQSRCDDELASNPFQIVKESLPINGDVLKAFYRSQKLIKSE